MWLSPRESSGGMTWSNLLRPMHTQHHYILIVFTLLATEQVDSKATLAQKTSRTKKGGAAQEGTKKAWWGRPRPGVDKIGEVDSKSHSATQQPNYPPSYGGRGLFSGFYRRTNMCISHTSITSIINDCFPSAGFFSLRVGTAEVCINASRKKSPFIKV